MSASCCIPTPAEQAWQPRRGVFYGDAAAAFLTARLRFVWADGWGMAWSDVLVHDCGPMGNDCHLAQGPLGEGPLTAATPKVEGDFYAVRPRHFNIMRR